MRWLFLAVLLIVPHSGATPAPCPQNPGGNCTSDDAVKAISSIIFPVFTLLAIMGLIFLFLELIFRSTEGNGISRPRLPMIIRRVFYRRKRPREGQEDET